MLTPPGQDATNSWICPIFATIFPGMKKSIFLAFTYLASFGEMRAATNESRARMEEEPRHGIKHGIKRRAARDAAGLKTGNAVSRASSPGALVDTRENGDFVFFSSLLHARGFLKQDGNYAGMDVDP